MSAVQTILTLTVVLGIASGQILWKLAADSVSASGALDAVRQLAVSPHFLGGLALYGAMTCLWVFVLQSTPLSRAYPFFALSFVLVPLLSSLFLSESLTVMTMLGAGLIVTGLVVMTSNSAV